MRRRLSFRLCLLASLFLVTVGPRAVAEFGDKAPAAAANASSDAKPETSTSVAGDSVADGASAPADSKLQREYARLAQLLNSTDTFGKREAAESLLKVRPSDVANPETRKLIARGYRALALEGRGANQDEAIRGLVIWGGKYSVPIVIELLDKDKFGTEELYDALAQLKDPQGAEAVTRRLGDFFTHEKAVNSLRRMGSVAEDALIKAAPSDDEKTSLAAVQLLGEVGSEKSNSILQRASSSRNYQVKTAAREALKRIRDRTAKGESVDKPSAGADPNSPFAESSGPPVDITARNTRDFARNAARNTPDTPGTPDLTTATDPNYDGNADLDEGDWSQVNALLPGDPEGKGVAPDPVRDDGSTGWKPQPVRLANLTSPHERPAAVSVCGGASPMAVVVYNDPFNKTLGRLETVNLRQRKSVGSSSVVGGVERCYLSPSGTRLLLVAQEGFHNRKARLEVWGINKGRPASQVVWWPFASSKGLWGANEVEWAGWIDDEQLLVVNGEGTTVLWRIDGKKAHAIYQIDANGHCVPALSPGRAHMALATPRGVEIFRASDGALLARMESVRPGAGHVAFNAEGTKLACVSGQSLYIWDATTGKLERDFDCLNLNTGGVSWLDKEHLLVGSSDVVDLTRRVLLWRYESTGLPSAPTPSHHWLIMHSNQILGLVPTQMLQPEVLAAAKELDPEAILAIKPGATVALDVQVGGEDQQKAEAALRAAAEQAGLEVASDSPIRIAARVVTGQSDTKEYGRGFFNREDRESVTVTSKMYEVEVTIDGQTAWKQTTMIQSGSAPPVIWMKEGQSAQQAVDEQHARFSANFGYAASLPRYLVHPKFAGPRGTSKISLGGT